MSEIEAKSSEGLYARGQEALLRIALARANVHGLLGQLAWAQDELKASTRAFAEIVIEAARDAS